MKAHAVADRALPSRQAALYCGTFILLGLTIASLGPTIPILAELTASSLGGIGILFFVRSLGGSLGAIALGRVLDGADGHRVVLACLAVVIVLFCLVPFGTSLLVLAPLVFCIGMAEGGVNVGGNTLIMWARPTGLGSWLNGLHLTFALGAACSPLIVAQMITYAPDPIWTYWAIPVLIVPVLFLYRRIPSPPHPRTTDTGTSATPMDKPLVGIVAATFFFYTGVEIVFGSWIYTYGLEQQLATETTAAYLTAAMWGGVGIGRLAAIPLAQRLLPRQLLIGCFVLAGAMLTLGAAYPSSALILWIVTPGLGIALGPVFPTMLALAGRYMTVTGKINGIFFMLAGAGAMLFPWTMGLLFDYAGTAIFLPVVLGTLLAATVCLSVVLVTVRRRGPLPLD
ncbi:MAG: MFS transporter [Bacteroidota bacterium]